MELPWHRARGKQRSMRDAPVSGSSLYDFRLRASSARRDPQPPQAASHGMFPALPTLCGARTAVVFEDDVRLLVLELTQAKQDDVSLRTRQPRHNSWERAAGPSAQAEQGCCRTTPIQTRLRSFPRMWHNRLTPSKQKASSRPFPSILVTCAYSVQRGSDGWQVAQAAWLSNYSGPP